MAVEHHERVGGPGRRRRVAGSAGFLLFGLSVLLISTRRHGAWGRAGTALHAGFGVLMVATGVFSTRSFMPGAAYDPVEDMLHSVAATAMGFAFAIGIVAVLLQAPPAGRRRRWPLDAGAVLAAVMLPLGMAVLPDVAGVLQRVMFAVA